MLGLVTQYELDYNPTLGKVELFEKWQKQTHIIEKVNALIIDQKRMVIGGFDKGERGIIEIWDQMAEVQGPLID